MHADFWTLLDGRLESFVQTERPFLYWNIDFILLMSQSVEAVQYPYWGLLFSNHLACAWYRLGLVTRPFESIRRIYAVPACERMACWSAVWWRQSWLDTHFGLTWTLIVTLDSLNTYFGFTWRTCDKFSVTGDLPWNILSKTLLRQSDMRADSLRAPFDLRFM